jgi:serine/threonine-protein kinase RsbW
MVEAIMSGSVSKKDITINSSVENLNYVEKEIESIFDDFKFSEEHFGNVLIAVTEAVNNAVHYGNQEDVTKVINLNFTSLKDQLVVTIKDQGEGFDYESLPDPTDPNNLEKLEGRGIYLMKHLSDSISFSDNGSKVELVFKF